jgi:hypothetical protein
MVINMTLYTPIAKSHLNEKVRICELMNNVEYAEEYFSLLQVIELHDEIAVLLIRVLDLERQKENIYNELNEQFGDKYDY